MGPRAALEQKVATTPKAMKEVFGRMPRSRIALETGMHSPWVSRLLGELGHEVIVGSLRLRSGQALRLRTMFRKRNIMLRSG
jgi:hypothetical protein